MLTLDGVKILDMSQYMPGHHGTCWLASTAVVARCGTPPPCRAAELCAPGDPALHLSKSEGPKDRANWWGCWPRTRTGSGPVLGPGPGTARSPDRSSGHARVLPPPIAFLDARRWADEAHLVAILVRHGFDRLRPSPREEEVLDAISGAFVTEHDQSRLRAPLRAAPRNTACSWFSQPSYFRTANGSLLHSSTTACRVSWPPCSQNSLSASVQAVIYFPTLPDLVSVPRAGPHLLVDANCEKQAN